MVALYILIFMIGIFTACIINLFLPSDPMFRSDLPVEASFFASVLLWLFELGIDGFFCVFLPLTVTKKIRRARNQRLARLRPPFGLRCEPFHPASGQTPAAPNGVHITLVHPDTPAALAKIPVGAIITAVNGIPIMTLEDFKAIADRRRAGDRYTVTAALPEEDYAQHTYDVIFPPSS